MGFRPRWLSSSLPSTHHSPPLSCLVITTSACDSHNGDYVHSHSTLSPMSNSSQNIPKPSLLTPLYYQEPRHCAWLKQPDHFVHSLAGSVNFYTVLDLCRCDFEAVFHSLIYSHSSGGYNLPTSQMKTMIHNLWNMHLCGPPLRCC